MFENGLFIFRRDYRMIDNKGLHLTNSKCKKIHTIYIFTPEQVSDENKFKSDNAVQFMIKSLEELADDIHHSGGLLHCFYGNNNRIIKQCIDHFNIDYVCFNADYSPYAIERDGKIMDLCKKTNILCELAHDYYLNVPGSILNSTGKPYQKFTPYYNEAVHRKVAMPIAKHKLKLSNQSFHTPTIISLRSALTRFTKINEEILVHGGRKQGLLTLQNAHKLQKTYSKTHNDLEKQTTQLSAYIKFGCISIREVFHTLRNHDLIRQIYWREFYMQILYCFPYVLGKPMKPNYSKIRWHKNDNWLKAWKNGRTGFPVVDAGMIQLNTTGYMHNRARLIVASFLIKVLLIDWREGELYFARRLTDYDPASNNGNWQWVASTGADSQPFFRIFNPWLQSENFDPDATYVKKWIPELANVPAKDIHTWNTSWKHFTGASASASASAEKVNYPKPICDFNVQKEKALKMYSAVFH